MLTSETRWHHLGFEIQPYIGTIMKLFNVYVTLRNLPMAFVSLGTKVKSRPEVCICTSATHRTMEQYQDLTDDCSLFNLSEPLLWMLSPGNPSELPAVGATPAAPLSLLWSLQGKGAPSWWPPCTPVEPRHHFPSCCLIFQNASVPTQLGFFSSQIRSGFSYCNVPASLGLGIVIFTYIY